MALMSEMETFPCLAQVLIFSPDRQKVGKKEAARVVMKVRRPRTEIKR